ncbi:MAG: light-mediated development protein DET1 [Rhodococcus sp.]|nr:light-mediated development protein DET1 [Rhodococcus sp. (in: high G+C Gram-positive bacteria)]
MSVERRELVGYLDSVTREGNDEPERVMLHARDERKVYIRAVDPCDPEPERVAVYAGDEILMMEHLSHSGLHLAPEGDEGFLLSQRIVPVQEEPGVIYARHLRHGEADDGRRVHVRPGTKVSLDPYLDLDIIDEFEFQGVEGYVPLTPVLFTWLVTAGKMTDDSRRRYLLSAARRLDLAHSLFQRVEQLRQRDPEGAPATRRAAFELIGCVEMAVVSLSRAMDMCERAAQDVGATTAVPAEISSRCTAVRELRNAYEHIEDRALGRIRGDEHPDALTIFEHSSVVERGVITYRDYQLDLAVDVPTTISAIRQFLKAVAGETP